MGECLRLVQPWRIRDCPPIGDFWPIADGLLWGMWAAKADVLWQQAFRSRISKTSEPSALFATSLPDSFERPITNSQISDLLDHHSLDATRDANDDVKWQSRLR